MEAKLCGFHLRKDDQLTVGTRTEVLSLIYQRIQKPAAEKGPKMWVSVGPLDTSQMVTSKLGLHAPT